MSCDQAIKTLLEYSFDSSDDTAQAAQRVVANAMLLKPETRQMFVSFGYETKACQKLKSNDFDNQFLVSRIIFLATYDKTIDLKKLLTKHDLAGSITSNLSQHAKLISAKPTGPSPPMRDMALDEMLRLMFNITHFCKNEVSLFVPAIQHIIPLFWKKDIPERRPLDSPFGPLVNSLVNLTFEGATAKATLYPTEQPSKLADRLCQLLNSGLREYDGNDLDVSVTPLIGVLAELFQNAPDATKKSMRDQLLPTAEDRKVVLGKGNTLPSRLLRSCNNPMAPKLGTAVSHFLFDLSDKDASKFVENVGYGFASGFLFQNKIPMPASAQETHGPTDSSGKQRAVNPITGQFLDQENHVDTTPMTEEEKEREAERLFVLFERFVYTAITVVCNSTNRK